MKKPRKLPVFMDREPMGILSTIAPGEEPQAEVERETPESVGFPVRRLDPRDLRGLEPELRADLVGAWLVHDGHRLDPAASPWRWPFGAASSAGPWTTDLLRPLGLDLPVVGARVWLVRLRPDRPLISHWIEGAARLLFRQTVPSVRAAVFAMGVAERVGGVRPSSARIHVAGILFTDGGVGDSGSGSLRGGKSWG